MGSRLVELKKKLVRYVERLGGTQSVEPRPRLPSPRLADTSPDSEAAPHLEVWAARALLLLREALGVPKAALLTASKERRDDSCMLQVKPLQEDASVVLPTQIYWPWALCDRFREAGTIALQREIERMAEFQAIPRQGREWLRFLDMGVYVSLGQEQSLSILALGPRGSGDLSHSERSLILMLVNRARSDHAFREAPRGPELARLGAELQRLEEAKSGFLTIASHELKTPLTLIQGYANMLGALSEQDRQNKEKIGHITEGIIRGTGRLRQIIDDMADVSRIDARALNLQWHSCSLVHMVGLAVSQVALAAKERGQTINIQSLEGLPTVEGDGQRLCQALRNVLENAIKYTPDGGQISIAARLLDDKSAIPRSVEITVTDQGIGIAPENQGPIFDRFSRLGDADLHSSSKVQFKGGGPGLGLTISRGIIEAHGGKVWVESEGYDEKRCPGSQFHIRLPLKRADQVS